MDDPHKAGSAAIKQFQRMLRRRMTESSVIVQLVRTILSVEQNQIGILRQFDETEKGSLFIFIVTGVYDAFLPPIEFTLKP